MNIIEIIIKKRDKKELSEEEINYAIKSYSDNSIKDYQMSALLMAITINGLSDNEIIYLTKAMLNSGVKLDLSEVTSHTADKHSTGGVGDKTSLVLAPLVASCKVVMAKMSGRGLGHTGGTIDKLESIPGFSIELTPKKFIKQLNEIGIAIIGQSEELNPADKRIYALRDVTGTVESLGLIASSIMSKKLATGADSILLDVKYGSGAFMKDIDSATELAKKMCDIGNAFNVKTNAIISKMTEPLGKAIGNSIEVIEAVETLKGNGPSDLEELTKVAAAVILRQAGIVNTLEDGETLITKQISNGEGLEYLKKMIRSQGGDISYIENTSKFEKAKYIHDIYLDKTGYISEIDALKIGKAAMLLGAGRKSKEDNIDYSAGIYLHVKVGDKIKEKQVVATLYTNKADYFDIIDEIKASYLITSTFEKPSKLIERII